MEELQAIRLGHLTQDGSFSFLNFTKKKLTLLPQDSSEPELPDVQSVLRTLSLKSPRLQKAVDKFVEAVEAFDAALRMARKKPLTEQLSAADEDRDKAWMGSNTYINAMLNHPDAEVAAVAKIAREIFDKYGNPTRLSRKEESSSLHNLLQDIEAMESRSTIDFDPWYNWMKTSVPMPASDCIQPMPRATTCCSPIRNPLHDSCVCRCYGSSTRPGTMRPACV